MSTPPGLPRLRADWTLGIDTSVAQGVLDVGAIFEAGARFIIAKATDGEWSIDPQWAATSAAVNDDGRLVLGAYGVDEPGADPVAQAKHLATTVRLARPTIVANDFEEAHGLTGKAALARAAIYCRTFEAETGQRIAVYCGRGFIATLAKYAGDESAALLAELAGEGDRARPLWASHYTQDLGHLPMIPPGWGDWTLWQASGGHEVSRNFATLPGKHVDVDVDVFRGSVDELCAMGLAPAVS